VNVPHSLLDRRYSVSIHRCRFRLEETHSCSDVPPSALTGSQTSPTDEPMHGKWARRVWLPGARFRYTIAKPGAVKVERAMRKLSFNVFVPALPTNFAAATVTAASFASRPRKTVSLFTPPK
jgi:hypothetical protein